MKPIDQTKLHYPPKQHGNCLAASLASILEISIDDIPEFEEMGCEWWQSMLDWLFSLGFELLQCDKEIVLRGYYLAMGKSPRGDFNHQVVYYNGKMIHDPHPSKNGIVNIKEILVLLPLNPAKCLR